MSPHFDSAARAMSEFAIDLDRQGFDVVVVRDVVGRLTLVIDDRADNRRLTDTAGFADDVRSRAGRFAAATPVVLASELFDPEAVLDDPDLRPLDSTGRLVRSSFLDRQVVGSDWTRVKQDPAHQRVTLYGYKGGVGRSTAAFMLAKHLAGSGSNVLVVDLDLESPGVGPLLHTAADAPEYGLVDHLVESAVGPVTDLDLVVRSNRVTPQRNGEVWAAPARGRARDGYSYLPKLNRIYADHVSDGRGRVIRFAERLDRAISACEEAVALRSRPVDITLLDSRAGVHDIAAASITQLSDLSLLFATDNQQTWTGYAELFDQWRATGTAAVIRERLRVVSSMTPSRDTSGYLARFRDRAQECFAELYDDAEGGDDMAYNPAPDDHDAPHSPLPILFSNDLVGLDQSDVLDWHDSAFVHAAYEQFLEAAADLVTTGS